MSTEAVSPLRRRMIEGHDDPAVRRTYQARLRPSGAPVRCFPGALARSGGARRPPALPASHGLAWDEFQSDEPGGDSPAVLLPRHARPAAVRRPHGADRQTRRNVGPGGRATNSLSLSPAYSTWVEWEVCRATGLANPSEDCGTVLRPAQPRRIAIKHSKRQRRHEHILHPEGPSSHKCRSRRSTCLL